MYIKMGICIIPYFYILGNKKGILFHLGRKYLSNLILIFLLFLITRNYIPIFSLHFNISFWYIYFILFSLTILSNSSISSSISITTIKHQFSSIFYMVINLYTILLIPLLIVFYYSKLKSFPVVLDVLMSIYIVLKH